MLNILWSNRAKTYLQYISEMALLVLLVPKGDMPILMGTTQVL
jgi:hypothetical protein